MLDAVRIRWRAMRRRGHVWLRSHPRAHALLHSTGSLHGSPEAIARGVAVGLLIGLTPTVGIQTVLMIALCVLVAGNFPAAFAISWVSNPLTLAPMVWAFHELGEVLLSPWASLLARGDVWYLRGAGDDILCTAAGSLAVAIPAAIAGYFIAHVLSQRWHSRRLRRLRSQGSIDSDV
ncbi:DUF2062 domain-containing protein [Thioalkalivibrio sulfidiphilus]|uniref:DUF2062 domain-containing protein n=1 Tax=Thioalkalivibrio sulfidiphilus (strain HL-EbGR7) TaxID=396588 RepID=B8GMZ1_THISH|nr:DUF2062 domain-containing protein [Thioalkalivibrio sulfidiphilus]ACL73806.1 conserved hypothetical protein [Thioalkalivibrio sulfidiphilus HL-EbGr7]